MLTVRNIRVATYSRDSLTVAWEIASIAEDLAQYTVSVWRSESLAGPYTRVSFEMIAEDYYDFTDTGVNLLSKWREFYYRIRITKVLDATFVDFGSEDPARVEQGADPGGVVLEAPPDLEALEAIRRFELVLREFGGRRVLGLVQKTWGQRCPACWDHLKRRRNTSRCITCFDVGVVGGYFSPMETFCLKPPHQVTVQMTQIFELQVDDRVLWFSNRPRLKPRDLIIDPEGNRLRVIATHRSEKGWALTRQTVQVRRLSRDQVEYDYPVTKESWAVNSLTAGAMRQHIRATDIESYHKAVQDLGLSETEVFPEKGPFATEVESSDASE